MRARHPAGAKVALYTGALEPYERIDLLLDAASAVFDADPSWCLIVAGEGSRTPSVRAFADTTPNLVMLGRVDPSRFAAVAKEARVILNPGRIGTRRHGCADHGTSVLTTRGAQHAPEYSYLRPDEDVVTTDDNAAAFAKAWLRMTAPTGRTGDRPRLDSGDRPP